MNTRDGYLVVDFDAIRPVPCPCGNARRALVDAPDFPGTIHRTEIDRAAKLHYHRRLTETYYILQCEPGSQMRLGDDLLPVHAGMCIMIRPGTPHCAIGRMTVLIVVLPKFDPNDEVLVEDSPL